MYPTLHPTKTLMQIIAEGSTGPSFYLIDSCFSGSFRSDINFNPGSVIILSSLPGDTQGFELNDM